MKSPGFLDLLELILKNPSRVNELVRDPRHAIHMVPVLLLVPIGSLTIYGITLSALMIRGAVPLPGLPGVSLGDGSAPGFVMAYVLGFLTSCGICLPSFYFYGLLAGLRVSMLTVAVHALKGLAVTGVALVGVLPIYSAFAMAMILLETTEIRLQLALFIGLLLPFMAGLFGARSLYLSFSGLCDTMRPEFRKSRECFLRRLVASWCCLSTVVTPVMIFRLWWAFETAP